MVDVSVSLDGEQTVEELPSGTVLGKVKKILVKSLLGENAAHGEYVLLWKANASDSSFQPVTDANVIVQENNAFLMHKKGEAPPAQATSTTSTVSKTTEIKSSLQSKGNNSSTPSMKPDRFAKASSQSSNVKPASAPAKPPAQSAKPAEQAEKTESAPNKTTNITQKPGGGEAKLMMLKASNTSGFVEYAYLAPKHLKSQFKEICVQTIDKQTEFWLKSFVKEFEGRIDEVLELAEEFKAYLPDEADPEKATCLEEFPAHVFLERKGQALSVSELREVMRNICADDNDMTKFSFIEYLVWSYQKTLRELFLVKPYDMEPLLKGLYQAIHDYQEAKAQHDAKTEELEAAVKQSGEEGKVVAGLVAQAKLKEVLTRGGTRRQKDSVFHKYKQKKAQQEFEARKAAELEAKRIADAEARKESKAKMAARLGAMDHFKDNE
eukprot:m.127369 g.127369  ORF g.127369 m.127369 type:complete len:437 (+) comp14544_c1_seq1:67-1377(+)